MTHWGWYWKVKRKHTPKPLCNQYACLDSFKIFKNENDSGFKISDQREGISGELMKDAFVITTMELSYSISVEKQNCHFGGFRYFFRCPNIKCQKRMRKLYYHKGMFLCRNCWNIGYYSQRLSPSKRSMLMKDKIENTLKAMGGSVYQKPKWMRWRTFERIKGKKRAYEWKHQFALENEVMQMYGHL